MVLTPEERREINRANAAHSTGPKSPDGRRRASLNAMKHGLRAETLALPGEDPEELKRISDDWVAYYQPRSPGERAAVDRCVYSHIQGLRCANFHAATVAEQVRKASFEWEWACEDEVERLKKMMKADPEEAVRLLKRSALGCRWMLSEWQYLAEALDQNGTWVNSQRDSAIRLCGSRPEAKTLAENEFAYYIRFFTLFTLEKPPAAVVDYLADPKNVPDTLRRMFDGTWGAEPEKAREFLRGTMAEQVADLTELEARLRTEIEEPSRAGAVERAKSLRGPDGVLLVRYARMHGAMYDRAYKELKEAEKEAAKGDAPSEAAERVNDLFGGVEVMDFSVGRADAPNEANGEGPIAAVPASAGGVGEPFAGLKVALVDMLGGGTGLTDPPTPLGRVETPPTRGS
jgi:hypothetical protein